MPFQAKLTKQPMIKRRPGIERRPAFEGGGSAGRRILLALVVLSCLLQLIGLYRPAGPPTVEALPFLDKLGHLLIFALPVALIVLHRGWRGGARATGRFGVLVIVIFAVHAVISELVQAWLLTQRSGDPLDVLADLAGIVIGYGTAVLILRRRRTARQQDVRDHRPGDNGE